MSYSQQGFPSGAQPLSISEQNTPRMFPVILQVNVTHISHRVVQTFGKLPPNKRFLGAAEVCFQWEGEIPKNKCTRPWKKQNVGQYPNCPFIVPLANVSSLTNLSEPWVYGNHSNILLGNGVKGQKANLSLLTISRFPGVTQTVAALQKSVYQPQVLCDLSAGIYWVRGTWAGKFLLP